MHLSENRIRVCAIAQSYCRKCVSVVELYVFRPRSLFCKCFHVISSVSDIPIESHLCPLLRLCPPLLCG